MKAPKETPCHAARGILDLWAEVKKFCICTAGQCMQLLARIFKVTVDCYVPQHLAFAKPFSNRACFISKVLEELNVSRSYLWLLTLSLDSCRKALCNLSASKKYFTLLINTRKKWGGGRSLHLAVLIGFRCFPHVLGVLFHFLAVRSFFHHNQGEITLYENSKYEMGLRGWTVDTFSSFNILGWDLTPTWSSPYLCSNWLQDTWESHFTSLQPAPALWLCVD